MSNMLTPKFLPRSVVEDVILAVATMVTTNAHLGDQLKRKAFHVVVIGPSMVDGRGTGYPDYPNYPAQPSVLGEMSFGNKEVWSGQYDSIARCKALQLWWDQNEDGLTDIVAHLLFPDDTRYWGGVKRHGLVAACSGVEPYFDQMISGMTADALKAVARHAYETSPDKINKKDFLT
jgi:hypothetical protein